MRMRDGTSVLHFQMLYVWRSNRAVEILFWVVFALQVAYSIVYYCIAAYAIRMKKPKYYQLLGMYGAVGIVGLLLLTYIDKFNLIAFFLHLLTYIYSRFLQGLTASLVLLPPLPTV